MPKHVPIRVRLLGARFVTSWRWSVTKDPEDTCGICRLAYESVCPTCKLPGEDCPPIIGQCKHAFHMRAWRQGAGQPRLRQTAPHPAPAQPTHTPRPADCIMTWLGTSDKENVCPLCRAPWEMDVS